MFRASDSTYIPPVLPEVSDSVELWQLFHVSLPTYLEEIAVSLLPIIVMFGIFQFVALHMDRRSLGRIAVGLAYTYVGLVLFLTGANVGFMPAGNYLGQVLAGQSFRWIIIPIGMLIGYFIVKAEPAVYVLNKQVEEVTDGAISAKAMGTALSAGVSISVGLAMVRVLTGVSILWFLVPGYVFAIGISFVVPKLFTAIAFDAGGVASGPMTATFLLPLAQGGRGRQYRHRRFRRGGHGGHDPAHYGAADGPCGTAAHPQGPAAAACGHGCGLCRTAGR